MKPTVRTALHAAGAVLGILGVLLAVLVWRLSSGPISLDFLSPYVKEALHGDGSPYRIDFDHTVLTWGGWSRALDVRMTGVRIAEADGRTLVEAPQVSLGLNRAALLRGVIALSSIELIGPQVKLLRRREGKLGLAGAGGPEDDALGALAANVLAPPHEDYLLARLERVGVADARLTLEDESTGRTLTMREVGLVIDADQSEVRVEGRLSLDAPDHARVGFLVLHRRDGGRSDVLVTFSRLNPASLAAFVHGSGEALSGVRAPLSGKASFGLTPAGAVEEVDFEVTGGSGGIDLPDVLPAPVPVRRLAVVGTVDAGLSRLRFESFRLDTPGPSFLFNGVVLREAAGVGVEGRFQAIDLRFDELSGYWPEDAVSSGGRRWILGNVDAGVITRLDAALAIEPGAFENRGLGAAAVSGTLAFEDARVHYLRPMPPVEGMDGVGSFTAESLELELSGAKLSGVAAPRATARLSGVLGEGPRLRVAAEAEGAAADVLALLDHPRLALVSGAGLRPERVGGRVRGGFTVDLPLLAAEEMEVTAAVRVDDGRMTLFDGRFDVTRAALRLDVGPEGMDAQGTVRVQDVPATVGWRENFGADAPFARRYHLSATLAPEGQAAFGIDPAPYVQGGLGVQAVFTDPGRGPLRAGIEIDAKEARLEVPEIRWVKPEGEAGRVSLRAEFPADGGVELAAIDVRTGSLSGLGRAALGPGLDSLRDLTIIARIRHGRNDFAGRIERVDSAGWRVSVTGASLDARPYLKGLMDEEEAAESTPLTLDLEVGRLVTAEDQQLTDSRGRFVTGPAGRRTGFLQGKLPAGRAVRLTLDPLGAKRRVIVRSDDAGAVARAFDLYGNAVGGRLLMDAVVHDDLPDRPVTGTVTVSDYRVINAPTLAEILSVASLTGVLDLLRSDGIAFSTFTLPFSVEGGVLAVEDAKAAGAALGINAQGTVDLETDAVRIRGTIVPAYAINSIVGNIPLLGDLLQVGRGEGLFAATYRVTGSRDRPAVAINPLSSLAPAFVRKLFSFPEEDDGAGKQPGKAARTPAPPSSAAPAPATSP